MFICTLFGYETTSKLLSQEEKWGLGYLGIAIFSLVFLVNFIIMLRDVFKATKELGFKLLNWIAGKLIKAKNKYEEKMKELDEKK